MNILKRFRKKANSERSATKKSDTTLKYFAKRYYVEIGTILALTLVLTLMFPRGKSPQFADLREGEVWHREEVIATFTFPVLKSTEEYESDKQEARESVIPVFVVRDDIKKNQLDELADFTNRIALNLKAKVTTVENIKDHYNQAGIGVSDEDIHLLLNAFESDVNTGKSKDTGPRVAKFENLAQRVLSLVEALYSAGILDRDKEEVAANTDMIRVRKDGIEEQEPLQFYRDRKGAAVSLLDKLRETEDLTEKEVKIAYAIGEHFITSNILYDREETNVRIAQAEANVPLAKDQVLEGERIIDSHEVLTKAHIEKLNSLAVAKAERSEREGFWAKLPPTLGKFLLILTILAVLAIYLKSDKPAIFNDRKKLLLICINIFFIAIFAFISNRFSDSPYSSYFVPISTLSLIITIFFDTRVGLFVTVTAALLIGALRGNEYTITFTSIFVGAIAVQTVRKVRARNWIVRSGLYISAAYIFVIFVTGLVTYVDFSNLENLRSWSIGVVIGALNGFLAPGIAYLLIIILESIFDLTTDMTLLELSDFNHPLLRQLHLEAPGTYHHSYLVGMLAEAATEALGGNALLARVGSYYHDIGKLEKPEYFVENQTKGRNPQEKLTPTMSSLILSNHVRRGAEIAREYGLPREIEAFIYQHHGTSLMSFFYQKALELGNDDSVTENEFRYPGPRPQTRETAIVMMADAVEAASRTLKDPTPSRIKGLVEQIIDERFKSGELDDSPLTLQDLSKISVAFQKILNGRFHGRVEYPNGGNNKKQKDEK
ncbi:HDIG domain-containing protein [candidate division KSB1 bacterium]|nr:HDIG domain-containing protein [candidate division KSB1 bacterium]RQW00982.1 MAG: HDIG domain-containing protein [candidate division KSB1 bacterium]